MSAGHYDETAEQASLGAMILSSDAIIDVTAKIGADDYYRPAHSTIHAAICDLHEAGTPVDLHTLRAHLDTRGTLDKVGGAVYLATLAEAPVTAMSGGWYAAHVADCATRRRLTEYGARVRDLADGEDLSHAIDRAQTDLARIVAGRGDADMVLWRDITPAALDTIEQAGESGPGPAGLPTGLVDLDQVISGLCPGQLVIVAGRPGAGKSVLTVGNFVRAAMDTKTVTAMFSLEMSTDEVFCRHASSACRIDHEKIREGRLDDRDWTALARYAADTADHPLWINTRKDMTLADIRANAHRIHRQHGLGLIVVDYLQLVSTPRAENRQVAVSQLARGLKLLAQELHVPVVVAAQLNRGPEQRTDKRPQLSDLRESGSIEQDADVVILLHRDRDEESPRAGEADLIVAKNRHGREATITVAAQLHYQRFVSMAVA